MCRIAAYIGPPRPLQDVIVTPPHSLLRQSQAAAEAKLAYNGDGFGMAWYAGDAEPGHYRDVLPAWSDGNLPSLCRAIRAPVFVAHVRAATAGETMRTNCHPFVHGRWSFVHNGRIANFDQCRRRLEANLPEALYLARRGTTDSELFFLLMLVMGLDDDPLAAFWRAFEHVAALSSGVLRFAVVVSDGVRLWAFRASSDGRSPSLYLCRCFAGGGSVVASEPLGPGLGTWEPLDIRDGRMISSTLQDTKAA